MKKKFIYSNAVFVEGWTFIETLIVMAIVMILTASVGFSAVRQVDKARAVTAKSQIDSLVIAMDSYYLDVGSYPSEGEGLAVLWNDSVMYVSKPLEKDPWGNPFVYRLTGNNDFPYEIVSYGKDGRPGGSGIESDIVSH